MPSRAVTTSLQNLANAFLAICNKFSTDKLLHNVHIKHSSSSSQCSQLNYFVKRFIVKSGVTQKAGRKIKKRSSKCWSFSLSLSQSQKLHIIGNRVQASVRVCDVHGPNNSWRCVQSDQIWQNFTFLEKFCKSVVSF